MTSSGAMLRLDEAPAFDCRTCGACCAYSPSWPRFTLEDDATIARIPQALVNASGNGLRCTGNRCAALEGTVKVSVSCTIYSIRPDVGRSCLPGDEACLIARSRFNLSPIPFEDAR